MSSTPSITVDQAINYLDILHKFIENDISAAIKAEANYLAALGLSTYTEIMGGLYSGDLSGKARDLSQHYICFINDFFHPDYKKVDSDLQRNNLKGLYGAVRSGLTHEYFIKKVSKIEIEYPPQQSVHCGITFDPNSSPQIIFYVKQYFDDFKCAFAKYYSQLKFDDTGSMLSNFEKALQSINSSLLTKIYQNFSEDVSGKRP